MDTDVTTQNFQRTHKGRNFFVTRMLDTLRAGFWFQSVHCYTTNGEAASSGPHVVPAMHLEPDLYLQIGDLEMMLAKHDEKYLTKQLLDRV